MKRMNRRDFLSQAAGTLGLLGGWSLLPRRLKAQSAKSGGPRANIVLIMADDMGFADLGCYGGEIQTPHLDALAKRGLRFTQFYNAARCCPTRASLLTGLYPHQAGMGGMVTKRPPPPDAKPSPYQGYLNTNCVTIAEAIRRGGYSAYMSGKWHVGENHPVWPVDRGFEKYFGLISGGSNYWKLDGGRKMALGNKPYTPEGDGFYMTDAFSDHAVRFLEAHRGRKNPFFLYVAYTSPHWPLHAWPKDTAKYKGKYRVGWEELRKTRHQRQIELGLVDKRWPLSPLDAKPWNQVRGQEEMDLKMAIYAAQIECMDRGIGQILRKIREIGVEDNTLVIFLADNGGCHEGGPRGFDRKKAGQIGLKDSFSSYGRSWANLSNTPFRMYKHWVHEGGIASPLIAYWPAVIRKGGQITHQVGHVIDLMATCLDVAGVGYPKTHNGREITPLEGKSLLPILRGRARKGHEYIYWEHMGNRAVRMGKWKLVSRSNEWELYDLEADRTELNNLAAKRPELVEQLKARYEAWAKKCGVRPRGQRRKKKRPGKPAAKNQ